MVSLTFDVLDMLDYLMAQGLHISVENWSVHALEDSELLSCN